MTLGDAAMFVGGALCLVSLLASYLPARRAARLDPLMALGGEGGQNPAICYQPLRGQVR